jgi:hypothetical protein
MPANRKQQAAVIGSARLATLVQAIGAPAIRPLIPAATSSAPLLTTGTRKLQRNLGITSRVPSVIVLDGLRSCLMNISVSSQDVIRPM